MKIAEKTLVILQYTLQVKNEDGTMEVMEQTTPEAPMQYINGIGMMLPKFEEQMNGLEEGDKFDFMISKEDAYGEYEEENVIELPKDVFKIEGEFDEENIFAGAIVPLQDAQGNRFNAEVVKVNENSVEVDLNHPLAGEDLYFTGRIISVTQLTDEQIAEMMKPHCHCGGDCGGDCNCEGDCSHDDCHCGGKCDC